MSTHQDKVVVLVTPEISKYKSRNLFAARFPELGLTAYGSTEEQAWDDLKLMYRRFISELRQKGVLEERLNQVGAKWYWAEEYLGDSATDAETTTTMPAQWDEIPCPRPFRSLELVA